MALLPKPSKKTPFASSSQKVNIKSTNTQVNILSHHYKHTP